MSRPRLLIVRGLPGAGKSTYVRKNYPGLFTLETDCFNCVAGQYDWNVDRSKEAIRIIDTISIEIMSSSNTPDFAISGVFGRPHSILGHIYRAEDYGYDVYIKTLTTQYPNIHNVPKETIQMFKDNFLTEEQLKETFKTFQHIFYTDMPEINWKFRQEKKPNQEELKYEGEG